MVMRYYGSKDKLFAAAADYDLRLPDLDEVPRDGGHAPEVVARDLVSGQVGHAAVEQHDGCPSLHRRPQRRGLGHAASEEHAVDESLVDRVERRILGVLRIERVHDPRHQDTDGADAPRLHRPGDQVGSVAGARDLVEHRPPGFLVDLIAVVQHTRHGRLGYIGRAGVIHARHTHPINASGVDVGEYTCTPAEEGGTAAISAAS